MIEISRLALEAAIQAVDEKIGTLQVQIEQNSDLHDNSHLKQELPRYLHAAALLRESHEEALWQSIDITPYDKLVRVVAPSFFDEHDFHHSGPASGGSGHGPRMRQ